MTSEEKKNCVSKRLVSVSSKIFFKHTYIHTCFVGICAFIYVFVFVQFAVELFLLLTLMYCCNKHYFFPLTLYCCYYCSCCATKCLFNRRKCVWNVKMIEMILGICEIVVFKWEWWSMDLCMCACKQNEILYSFN